MLLDIDERQDELFGMIDSLPIVLCHRDFWLENIMVRNGETILIDWDTAGWGYLGEDLVSLIVDHDRPEYVAEYYQRLLPAYLKGIAGLIDTTGMPPIPIREMVLIKFGYRLAQRYMFSQSPQARAEAIAMLQAIYDHLPEVKRAEHSQRESE